MITVTYDSKYQLLKSNWHHIVMDVVKLQAIYSCSSKKDVEMRLEFLRENEKRENDNNRKND